MKAVVLLSVISLVFAAVEDLNKDLQPEEAQSRIHDIIQSHENYKYGQHGGHEYEDVPIKEDRSGDQYPSYQLTYKDRDGHKGQGYFIVPPKRSYGVVRRKLKPVSSKIYDYYPKVDSSEEKYGSSPKTVLYYPEKKYKGFEGIVAGGHAPPPGPVPVHPVAIVAPRPVHHLEVEPHTYPIQEAPIEKPYVEEKAPVSYVPIDHPSLKPYVHVPKKQYILHEDPHYPESHSEHHVKDGHHSLKESGYADHGHGYHGDHEEQKLQDHHSHKDYESSGHKSHGAHEGHHDLHSKYHNKGSYERDRGYHYEKAYAYDRIRAHHDIGKSHDSHAAYKGHHAQEGHHNKGNHGAHSYMYFKKGGNHGAHGHSKLGHHLAKNGHYKKDNYYRSHVHPVTGYEVGHKYR